MKRALPIIALLASSAAWAADSCPQSFIEQAKWDGTDVLNGMVINQDMCTQMPSMACCKEFFEHQQISRPTRRHIPDGDLAPFPAAAPNLASYQEQGYCTGELVGRTRRYVIEATDDRGYFQLNVKSPTGAKCPGLGFPKDANRPMTAAPLFFNNGETAIITVKNSGMMPTTVHWHGLELENSSDGIPGITQPPIRPGESYEYRINLHQDGTYWYHPHTLQEQEARGAFIVFPKNADPVFKNPKTQYHHEEVLLLSDYLNLKPEKILAELQHDSGNMQRDGKIYNDLWTAYRSEGFAGFKRAFQNLKSMGMFAMDKADIYYSDFFINDSRALEIGNVKAGERIRLRIINGSSASYFYLDYANNKALAESEKMPMTIVAKDGKNVQPLEVDQIELGMGECYDVIVEVPEAKKGYELRLKSIDDQFGKRVSKVIIGENPDNKNIQAGYDVPVTTFGNPPDDHMLQSSYDMLKSLNPAPIDPSTPIRYYELELSGNMEDYYWQIQGVNGTKLTYPDDLSMPIVEIPENTRIHVTIHNSMRMGMMNHPIHLHGHFFRLIKKTDSPEEIQNRPFMHTATAFPGDDMELEFYSGHVGTWMFHCHNLYHMANSMMLAFKTSTAAANYDRMDPMKDSMASYVGDIGLGSDTVSGGFNYVVPNGNKGLNVVELGAEQRVKPGSEVDVVSGAYKYCYEVNKCVTLNVDWKQILRDGKLEESSSSVGAGYSYRPLNNKLLIANVAVYANQDVKASLNSEIPIAPDTTLNAEVGCEGQFCSELEGGFGIEMRPSLNVRLFPIRCTYGRSEGGTYCGAEIHVLTDPTPN